MVRKPQARGASEIEPNGSITAHRDTTRFEVEKIANEMFVMYTWLKEMIGVEHSGEVQGWLNEEEPVI